MLKLPEHGFARSETKNNIKNEVLGDWLEANLLFYGEAISKVDLVDLLDEEQICPKQELAHQIADDGWAELRRRKQIVGISDELLKLDAKSASTSKSWQEDPIRAFFIALSLFYPYPDWGTKHRNAPTQGLLFERVVEALASCIFPGWKTYRVGWAPSVTRSIHETVRELGELLNCVVHKNLDHWVPDQAKDAGLDLVCYRKFDDERDAFPVYLIQCASGSNWRSKVNTPSPDSWQRYLDSSVRPGTGIAAPFVVPAKKLRNSALQGQAIVLDRLRLLGAYYMDESIVDVELKDDIITWLDPFVSELPWVDATT